MAKEFTQNQKRAISSSGNIIVSAGAGSGKTTVMIARIIDKLKKGESLEKMLIVTFTRASAADMRVKLAEQLVKLKSTEFAAIANRAIDAMSVGNIGTLHSYCQKLVKTHFYAAGIDPAATICEESEASAMRRAAAAEAVSRAYAAGDPRFVAMYDMLSSRRDDKNVVKTVQNILDFALSMPDPVRYLCDKRADVQFFAELDGIYEKKFNALAAQVATLKADLIAAAMERHAVVIDEFCDFALGRTDKITSTRHTAANDYTDELNARYCDLKSQFADYRKDKAKAEQAKTVESSEYSAALCAVAYDAYLRYAERKEKLGKIDYSDLEHGAYRALCDQDCAREIARSVKYVFIDEFQDVNPLQSAIAQKFKQCGAEMFVVGDVKQSIYAFRRCSPEHFERAIADPDYTHIALSDNFRSSPQVIDFVNSVFDGVMTPDCGGVDYAHPDHRLVCGNGHSRGDAEFILVPQDDESERQEQQDVANDSVSSAEQGRERLSAAGYSVINDGAILPSDGEAIVVADCVAQWLSSDRAGERGNVAVLMRSLRREFCNALSCELKSRNIEFGIKRKNSAADYPESAELMELLRCIDNRFDDIALYAALRSPMGGFSDDELYEIARIGEREAQKSGATPIFGGDKKRYALWQKLTAYRGERQAAVAEFIDLRNRIAQFAQNHDCADVLGYITSQIDYFQYLYERRGDCNARAAEALIDYAKDRACDVHAFLTFYDEAGFELDIGGGDETVTVTTMHSAKGLEYDCVIVCDTAKCFNINDGNRSVIVSERGVFVKAPDENTHTIMTSAPWLVEHLGHPNRTRSEEMRLFYVALTRAKRRLIVCGKDKKYKKTLPCESKRMLDFMYNITPSPHKPPALVQSAASVEFASSDTVERAVKARIREIAALDNERKMTALPIKTFVTAVAAAANDGEEVEVLTADDRDDGNAENRTTRQADENLRTSSRVNLSDDLCVDSDGRRRGNAYHRAMELIDFSAPDLQSVAARCKDFELCDGNELIRAAKAMQELTKNAAFVAKERYFIADLPAQMVYGNLCTSPCGNLAVDLREYAPQHIMFVSPKSPTQSCSRHLCRDSCGESAPQVNVLVQGVIDLMFADGDGNVTIVDYKTGSPQHIKSSAAYATQLALYAQAVMRSNSGFKSVRTYLYAFSSGELIRR